MKLENNYLNLGKIGKTEEAKFSIELLDYREQDFDFYKVDCSCVAIESFDKKTGKMKGKILGSRLTPGSEVDKFIYIYEQPNVRYYVASPEGRMTVNPLKKRHKMHFSLEVES